MTMDYFLKGDKVICVPVKLNFLFIPSLENLYTQELKIFEQVLKSYVRIQTN